MNRREKWAAMHADAKQTEFCTYLSGILLGGLSLNLPFGLSSVDLVAGLVMVPIIAKEGIEGLRVKPADDCSAPWCEATRRIARKAFERKDSQAANDRGRAVPGMKLPGDKGYHE